MIFLTSVTCFSVLFCSCFFSILQVCMALSLGDFFPSVQSLSDQKKIHRKNAPFSNLSLQGQQRSLGQTQWNQPALRNKLWSLHRSLSERHHLPKSRPGTFTYPSSQNNGSGRWVPPKLVSFHLGSFSTSMIMGERVDFRGFFLLFLSALHFRGPLFWFSLEIWSSTKVGCHRRLKLMLEKIKPNQRWLKHCKMVSMCDVMIALSTASPKFVHQQ